MRLLIKRLLSYLPSKLPVGMTAFHEYADEVIELASQFADPDSMKFALANMIMHLPITRDRVPKNYFVKCLRKTAANQVAGQIFIDVKTAQDARRKAEEAQAAANAAPSSSTTLAEATATQQVASNETQKG